MHTDMINTTQKIKESYTHVPHSSIIHIDLRHPEIIFEIVRDKKVYFIGLF